MCFFGYGQDKVLFLNGKEITGKILHENKYEYTIKTDHEETLSIDVYRLFSVTKNNKETIVYEYDTLIGNFLSVKDMQLFVYGERDAHKTYTSKFASYSSLLVGVAAGYYMHKEKEFIPVATPLITTTISLPFGTKVKKQNTLDKSYINEDEYLKGYNRIAKSKRTQNVLKSTIAGMAVGFLTSLIVNSN